jgi:membrane-associated phospholipid phosphatase
MSRRWPAVGVLLAVVGLAALTEQVVTAGPLTEVDARVKELVLAHHNGVLDAALQGLSTVAASAVVAPALAVLVLALAVARRSWQPVLLGAVALGSLGVLVLAGKALLGRAGPDRGPDVLHVGGASFPSGHAAIAVLAPSVAVLLLVRTGKRFRWWCGVLLYALAVGVARVYVNEHWTSDVLAGWLVGLLLLVPVRRLAAVSCPTTVSGPAPESVGTFGPAGEDFRSASGDRGPQ